MAAQQAKCTNFGNCEKADAKEIIAIPEGQDLICPSCKQPLRPIAAASGGFNPAPLLALLAVLAVVLGGIFLLYKNLFGGKDKAGSATGTQAAVKLDGPQGLLGRPLRVGVVYWPGYTGGIFANNGFQPNRECIFWKGHNLLVQFVDLEDPDAANKAFAKGGPDGVDVIWSTVDYWANQSVGLKKSGTDARVIMQVDWSRGGDAIVADNSIQKIEDLAGKKIALIQFTPSHWLLEYNIDNSSMPEEARQQTVTGLVNSNSQEEVRDAFIANRVPAAVLWEPFVSEALKKRPNSHIVVSSAAASNLIADTMVAQESFIRDHADVLQAFVGGWLEGATEANRNPAKSVQLLMDNEPPYKQAGEDATRDGLGKVRIADLTDNTRMFGLDGKDSDFDRIFKAASQAWLRRGYVSVTTAPDQAKDDRFVRALYKQTPVAPPVIAIAKENPEHTKPVLTKPVQIHFATGSASLDPNAKTILDEQVLTLAKTFSNSYLHVEGNTDNVGNPKSNRTLSEHRAQAVASYLTAKGVNRNQLTATGNGPDKPVADNSSDAGRAQNRRTDIVVKH